jgi:hypothetical protein
MPNSTLEERAERMLAIQQLSLEFEALATTIGITIISEGILFNAN